MKKIIFFILLMLSLTPINIFANNSFYTNYTNEPNQQELCMGSLLSLIYPHISNEVNKYYGYPKQFDLYDAKILSIKKTPDVFEYEIVVEVETFTGAHNPPKGIETITILTNPMGTKIINFKHKTE